MLKTLKSKIALVAVAGLGFGLVSTVPAAFAVETPAQNAVTVRVDDTTFAVNPASAGGATVASATVTEGGNNELDAATVVVEYKATSSATGIKITGDPADVAAGGATACATLTGNVRLCVDPGANQTYAGTLAAGVLTIAAAAGDAAGGKVYIEVGRGALPGIYTMTYDTDGAGVTAAVSKSITVAGAPATISVIDPISTTSTLTSLGNNSATGTFNVGVKDSSGRGTYLLNSEYVVLSDSADTVTITNPALSYLTGAELSATDSDAVHGVVLTTSTTPSGAITLTAAANGWTGTTATGTWNYSNSASGVNNVLNIGFTAPANTSASATAVATVATSAVGTASTGAGAGAGQEDIALAAARKEVFANVNGGPTSFTFRLKAAASATGTAKYTIAATGLTTSPAAGDYLCTLTVDATNSYCDVTVTTSSITTDSLFTIRADHGTFTDAANAGYSARYRVTYKAPVMAAVKITPDTATVAAKIAGTVDLKAKATDQFGNARPNTTLYWDIAGRNTTAEFVRVTDVNGEATFSVTDKSTVTTASDDTVKVDIQSAGDNAIIDTITIKWAPDIAPTALTGLAYLNNAGTYNTAVTATSSVTADATNTAGTFSDQWYYEVTAKAASGATVAAVPVVFTVDNGFIVAETNNTAGDVDMTAATGVKTVTIYTDNTGIARVAMAGTLIGTQKVTATFGSLTATSSVAVKTANCLTATAGGVAAGAGATMRYITLTPATASAAADKAITFSAKVTDGFDNAMANCTINVNVSGKGRFRNGLNAASGTTQADGTVSFDVISNGDAFDTTVSAAPAAALAATQMATPDAAGTPLDSFKLAVASATATGTFTAVAAGTSATDTAITAVKADVKAVSDTVATLSKAVTTIQSSVTELTSSFSAQIKSLSSAIAKISRAIAALSKKIK